MFDIDVMSMDDCFGVFMECRGGRCARYLWSLLMDRYFIVGSG